MQSLAAYGSPSPSPSPPPQSRPKALPAVDANLSSTLDTTNSNSNDDNDDEYDPTDAFGLKNAEKDAQELTVQQQQATRDQVAVKSAPDVIAQLDPTLSTSLVTRPSDNVIFYNATYEDMSKPVAGPKNPWDEGRLEKQNALTGHIEQQHFSSASFAEQQRSFHVLGYAANPSIAAGSLSSSSAVGESLVPQYVGNVHAAFTSGGTMVSDVKPSRKVVKEMKRKRKAKGRLGEFQDPDSEGEEGEGAEEGAEGGEGGEGGGENADGPPKAKKVKEQREYLGPWAGWDGESMAVAVPTEEEYEEQEMNGGKLLNREERQKKALEGARGQEIGFGQEKSVFHGKETHDYLGRTYLSIPTSAEILLPTSAERLDKPRPFGEEGFESFVPKKCIHTWSGHTKGVSRIQLFPTSGHLILSASLDTRIKLWDVYREGKCLRTFSGHSKAVHDVTFNNSGSEFLSAAFDRQMKLWDTETGQAKQAFSNGKIPYCIKFNPDPANQHMFLAGMSDKKVIQYDIRSGEITQEYNQHLGPVNTITFVDDNRRFVTTSDDKTMRVWDFDIPVPIKLIADPAMHSMPAVGLHPNGKWLAATSLDNQIVLFGADTFKQNRKKRFAGHTIAGYTCEPRFSPDGRFISSGDGQGNMVFWDFKTSRIVGRLNRAHKQVIVSHQWLPHESSKLVTSSWDGLIKLWD